MAAMYVYLSELMNQFWNKGIALLTEFTVHRLVLAALVLAIKFYEDFYMDNKDYARIGGIHTQELNRLEVQHLKIKRYRMFIVEEKLRSVEFHLSSTSREAEEETMPSTTKGSVCSQEDRSPQPLATLVLLDEQDLGSP